MEVDAIQFVGPGIVLAILSFGLLIIWSSGLKYEEDPPDETPLSPKYIKWYREVYEPEQRRKLEKKPDKCKNDPYFDDPLS